MSKFKKALKKSGVSGSAIPSMAAKKAPTVKSKTVPVKAPAAKPSTNAAKKAAKAAHAKGKPAGTKGAVRSTATKAPVAAKAAPVGAAKAPIKPAAPAPIKKGAAAAASAKASEKASEKASAVGAKAATPAAKTPAATAKAAGAKDEAPVDTPKPAAAVSAKGKKGRAEEVPAEPEEEIILLDAEGRRYCRVRECDQASAVDGYCRYHYLLYWKNIQVRKTILSEGKLERYIEDLTARYPDKYLEMLKKDLRTEKDFLAAIQELEIDESSVDNEYEDEAQNYLDEVRGMSSEAGAGSDRDEEF